LGAGEVIEKPLVINQDNVLLKNKMTLSIPQVRGWALIVCALYNIFFFIVIAFNYYDKYYDALFSPIRLIAIPLIAMYIVFCVLLIVGLLGIQFAPPLKHVGQFGLILMIIRPINLLFFLIPLLAQGHDQIESFLNVPFFYVQFRLLPAIFFVPCVGYLVIGWLTIKTNVFSNWAGVFLLLSGLFYFATFYSGLYLTADSLHKVVFMTAVLTEALALAVYGRSILGTSKSAE
jgi:hypothetical protein